MELELGLAPPSNNPLRVYQELDLNNSINNGMDQMEKSMAGKDYHQKPRGGNNFPIGDHHGGDTEVESKASNLSLLLWSGQPDEDRPQKWRRLRKRDINSEEENQEIEGWPPINSLRKEVAHVTSDGGLMGNRGGVGVRDFMYVKVKMEGVAIGRKIDLGLHDSYQSLTNALIGMFTKCSEISADCTILYQDREGDWMLLGDVPWEMFIKSVQRMEIQRNHNERVFRLLSREILRKFRVEKLYPI